MKIALIVLLSVLAVLFILLLLPVRIYADYKRNELSNEGTLYIRYAFWKFGISDRKKKDKKEKTAEEKKSLSFEEMRDKISAYIKIFEETKDDVARVLDYTAGRALVFEKVYTEIEFGFEDAMHTGIFTGVLNGFIYGVLGFIHQHSTLKDMRVNIQPVFENPCLEVKTGCILRLKNVHIIIVAINILKILRKIRKTERSR